MKRQVKREYSYSYMNASMKSVHPNQGQANTGLKLSIAISSQKFPTDFSRKLFIC